MFNHITTMSNYFIAPQFWNSHHIKDKQFTLKTIWISYECWLTSCKISDKTRIIKHACAYTGR